MYLCCMYIYKYVYIYTQLYTYIHTNIYIYTHTYIHTYIHTCIHTYTHVYIYIYVYNMYSIVIFLMDICILYRYHTWPLQCLEPRTRGLEYPELSLGWTEDDKNRRDSTGPLAISRPYKHIKGI